LDEVEKKKVFFSFGTFRPLSIKFISEIIRERGNPLTYYPVFYHLLISVLLLKIPLSRGVPGQDLDFQCHMSWLFLCSVIWS